MFRVLLLLSGLTCAVLCRHLDIVENGLSSNNVDSHDIQKRFINPMFNLDSSSDATSNRLRTKRSYEDDCEKLQLCKLHARSRFNFLAAYELYFVNKENARLWDHSSRTLADCESRYGDCYKK